MENLILDINSENSFIFPFDKKVLKENIIDRKSKYTTLGFKIENEKDVGEIMKNLLTDKYFRKASHNTYAFRLKLGNGSILEGKNDDGEVGAGNCILRELKREEMVNSLVVVTRYFGGIYLNTDRYKNVINCSKEILKFKVGK